VKNPPFFLEEPTPAAIYRNPPLIPSKKQAYQFLRIAFSFQRYSFETVGNLSPPVLTEITFCPTKKQAYQFLRVAFSFLRYSFETVGNLSPPVLAESERSDA